MTGNLTTKQVAGRKGVTVKTVNLWAKTGRLPVAEVLPISNARMYDPAVVDAFDPKAPASPGADVLAGSQDDAGTPTGLVPVAVLPDPGGDGDSSTDAA